MMKFCVKYIDVGVHMIISETGQSASLWSECLRIRVDSAMAKFFLSVFKYFAALQRKIRV